MIEIYTDGSCLGNPGNGGWGFIVVVDGKMLDERSGPAPDTTNNIMELSAVIQALSWLGEIHPRLVHPLEHKIHIWTDSQYVMKGVQEWSKNWIKNGWQTAAGKPVKNKEYWQELLNKTAVFDLEWHWVKGHSGHPMNERVDELARAAAESI